METAAVLRRRIELAEELRSVTGTMKSLAAVSVHQYERSVHALREYVRTVELGVGLLVQSHPELLVTAGDDGADRGPILLVVFGSGRGLCGPLNRYVAQEARDHLDRIGDDEERTVLASGLRLAPELDGVGLHPIEVLDIPGSAEGIGTRVDELLVRIDAWHIEAGTGRVVLVHPRPQEGGRLYDPVVQPLLPLDEDRLRRLAGQPWPNRVLPTWRGGWREVFADLTRQLLFVDLHRAHAETQVCVHRARLAAMQAAEDSIDERLEELSTRFHRRRQAAITDELLDVISGFEAAGGLGPDQSGG